MYKTILDWEKKTSFLYFIFGSDSLTCEEKSSTDKRSLSELLPIAVL